MEQRELIDFFLKFGTAGLLGFLIGLERSMSGAENAHATTRDFVIIALLGAISAYVATVFDNGWLIVAGLLGVLALLLSGYWVEQLRDREADTGITTEVTAIAAFLLGVLILQDAEELAVALAIVIVIVLSRKARIEKLGGQIQFFELRATLRFLVITFIVLPILPTQSLDNFATSELGEVRTFDVASGTVSVEPSAAWIVEPGSTLHVYLTDVGEVGALSVSSVTEDAVTGRLDGAARSAGLVVPGAELRASYVPDLIRTMLSAIKPFKAWLIVVLVSFIGFVGYVLIKVVGASAGIGMTGLIGGLASSTVTTLSFAGRSKQHPSLNRIFAVAVILASSVMFPRVVLQIGVFNQQLMASIALPMLITGATGLLMAGLLYWRSSGGKTTTEEISFDNPFSLKSAVTFGLVFATILVGTRVATAYLGDAWLPLVAIVSGLTDADAIAFSVSDLQRAGIISLDWASFNLVLGSISNTYMKLFLVLSLGDRGLFKHCLVSFLVMGVVGIGTTFVYYDVDASFGG